MSSPRKSWWLGFGLIIGFWLWVGIHEYPAPFIDDAFYIGAGINLARHGVFSNPLCDCLATIGCSNHFFAYMPLHSYVLAGWLKLAGISYLTFHVLYTTLALLVSLLLFRFFPAGNYAWLCGLLISLAVFGLLGGVGLRPDALGLVFLVLGLDAYRSGNAGTFLLKNFFLGLALITFANVALLALLLSASSLVYQKVIRNQPMGKMLAWALALAAAYVICFLIFMACIDGRLLEFLHCMARSQQMGAGGVQHRFHLFTAPGIAKWIVVQTCFLALVSILIFQWRRDPKRREHLFFLGLSLAAFFVLGYSSINSATGIHMWVFGCLIASLFIIANEPLKPWVLGVWLLVFAIAAFGHAHVVIEDCLADQPPGPQKREALLAEIARLDPQRLYLDAYAMRELYDYRLPDNAFGYETSASTGWGTPHPGTLPSNSVSVVSVKLAFPTRLSPDAGKEGRPLRFFGRAIGLGTPGHDTSGLVFQNPYDLEIMDNRF